MPLNHYQQSVIKSLIRLTNRRIHQYIDDGHITDFSDLAPDFFFSDMAVKTKSTMPLKAVIATLDDLIDMKLVKGAVNPLGKAVFQLSDIKARLNKATEKETSLHE